MIYEFSCKHTICDYEGEGDSILSVIQQGYTHCSAYLVLGELHLIAVDERRKEDGES